MAQQRRNSRPELIAVSGPNGFESGSAGQPAALCSSSWCPGRLGASDTESISRPSLLPVQLHPSKRRTSPAPEPSCLPCYHLQQRGAFTV
ncbi:unnamed protein product [Lota lota]